VKNQLIIPLLQGKFSSPETMQKKPSKHGGENLISPVGFRRFPVKILPLTNPMSLPSGKRLHNYGKIHHFIDG